MPSRRFPSREGSRMADSCKSECNATENTRERNPGPGELGPFRGLDLAEGRAKLIAQPVGRIVDLHRRFQLMGDGVVENTRTEAGLFGRARRRAALFEPAKAKAPASRVLID